MSKKNNICRFKSIAARLAVVVMAALIIAGSLPAFAYRAEAASIDSTKLAATALIKTSSKNSDKTTTSSTDSEEPIREVHKVGIGKKVYCFFVTHNVVLTPEEIAGLDDEKLTDEILKRAGLYMKEENCKLASHKAITPSAWKKTGGRMFLGDAEKNTSAIDSLRNAAPTDGEPVRLHMDLIITTETPKATSSDTKSDTKTDAADTKVDTSDESAEDPDAEGSTDGDKSSDDGEAAKSRPWDSVKWYSTYKKSSPNSQELLYVVVATPADAKKGEDICKEEPTKDKNKKGSTPKESSGGGDEEEMLPEYRTINMTDRSGGPLEPTLKDGDPVTLEWIEPGHKTDSEGAAGLFDHAWALPAVIAAALAIGAAAFLVVRKRRKKEEV